jgi:hypothetical protein
VGRVIAAILGVLLVASAAFAGGDAPDGCCRCPAKAVDRDVAWLYVIDSPPGLAGAYCEECFGKVVPRCQACAGRAFSSRGSARLRVRGTKSKTISVTSGSVPTGTCVLCDACIKKGVKPPEPERPDPRPTASTSRSPERFSPAYRSPEPQSSSSPSTTAPREPEPAPPPPPEPPEPPEPKSERHPNPGGAFLPLLIALFLGYKAYQGLAEQSLTTLTLPATLMFLFCGPLIWLIAIATGMQITTRLTGSSARVAGGAYAVLAGIFGLAALVILIG